jgi:hypothetical protein
MIRRGRASAIPRLREVATAVTFDVGMPSATYYVQFAAPEEEGRPWHTIARVHDRRLAEEIARLATGSYMRTNVTSHYEARAVSRWKLEQEGTRQHADWELGIGPHRWYGEALREKAERNLRLTA